VNYTKNFIAPCLRICKTLFFAASLLVHGIQITFLFYYSKVTDGSENKIYPVKELSKAILLFRTEDKKSTGFITNASFKNCNSVLKQL